MLTLTQRIEAGADRGHDLTFVVGGDHVAVPYRQLHEEARGLRRQPPGARRGPRRPRRPPRPDLAAARHRHPGRLVERRHGRGAPAPDAAVVDRGVRRTRPASASPTPTSRWCSSTPSWRRSSSPSPVTRRCSTGPRCSRVRVGPDADAWERPADDLDRLAILQFTSGSTSDPKGVMLPHRTVGANLDAIAHATSLDPDADVLVSWLPLYHDMGLVGLFTLAGHHRHPPRARRAHRLHEQPEPVDGVDLDVRRHRHRRPELLLRAGRPRAASERAARPVPAPNRAERRRARRPGHGRRLRRRGCAPRLATGGGVPCVRHGRGGHRRHVPRADVWPAHRSDRPARAGGRALRRSRGRHRHQRSVAGHPRPARARPRGPRGRSDHRRRAQGARGRASSRSAAPR